MSTILATTQIMREPKGIDAVQYSIVPDVEFITDGDDELIYLCFYKVIGEERTLIHKDIEGGLYNVEAIGASEFYYDEDLDVYAYDATFYHGQPYYVTLSKDNIVVASHIFTVQPPKGDKGEDGKSFSISKWADAKVGDSFYPKRTVNNLIIASVTIDENGLKWLCKKSFTIVGNKTAYEPNDGSQYWQRFNNFDNVATGLLLADYAVIDNLLLNNMKGYPKKQDAEGNYTAEWDTSVEPTVEIDAQEGIFRARKAELKDAEISGAITVKKLIIPPRNLFEYIDGKLKIVGVDLEKYPANAYDLRVPTDLIPLVELPDPSLYSGIELKFGTFTTVGKVAFLESPYGFVYLGLEYTSIKMQQGVVTLFAYNDHWVVTSLVGSAKFGRYGNSYLIDTGGTPTLIENAPEIEFPDTGDGEIEEGGAEEVVPDDSMITP